MTTSTLTVTEFVWARIAEDEAAVVSESHPFVGHVEDPEGEYWWECGWCYREGGHVSAAALAPAAQVEHAKSAHPTTPRILAQCAAVRKIVEVVSGWGHATCEDSWYSCAATYGTDHDYACCDDGRADTGCDCGLDYRIAQILKPLASIWSDHSAYDPAWA
jgi:hypothetical protein